MNALVLGDGFIGNKIKDYFKCQVSPIRVRNYHDIKQEIVKYHSDIVINCIGKTGRPNIDWCESNKEETYFSNVIIPQEIDRACNDLGKKMVHIGSGCIYSNGEFSECDRPNFYGSFYSRTKITAEEALGRDVLQLRIRMPISGKNEERNLISKLLKYDEIIDEKNSVTVIDDFLFALERLINLNAKGIFNVVNPDAVSHVDILNIYNKYSQNKKNYRIISVEELHKKTEARRSNCTLSTAKLNSYGVVLRNTIDAIEECVKSYVRSEDLCEV